MDDAERRGEEGKTHRCRAARAFRETESVVDNDHKVERLGGDVGDAAASRAAQNSTNHKVGIVQVRSQKETHL